ncbi:MAG TPA: cytochrome ubiquinol oxidase subunit I, partial [Deinococcales bacterium]|nr:cytochrome ubiquinol oxidase subunit I [Deinococcales bacterium]
KLPYLLSVLANNNTTGKVMGINDLQKIDEQKFGPGNYIPPVTTLYWSFRVMVGLGVFFILYCAWGLFLWWRDRLGTARGFQAVGVVALFLPYLANTTGWIITEMGRQPWIVYGLQKTASGVSPSVAASSVLVTMIGFTLLYAVLAVADFYLLSRFALTSPVEPREGSLPSGAHAY